MSVCCLWCVGSLGKERSKCFWIEDYRRQEKETRGAWGARRVREGGEGRGEGLMRSGCSAEEDEEAEGGWAERKGDGEGEINDEDSNLMEHESWFRKSLASTSLAPQVLASFCTLNDTTPDVPPDVSAGSLHKKNPPSVSKSWIWYQVLTWVTGWWTLWSVTLLRATSGAGGDQTEIKRWTLDFIRWPEWMLIFLCVCAPKRPKDKQKQL